MATVKNKYQVALVAPTEILANQHYANLKPLLDTWNIKSTLITGKTKLNTWTEIADQEIPGNQSTQRGFVNLGTGLNNEYELFNKFQDFIFHPAW